MTMAILALALLGLPSLDGARDGQSDETVSYGNVLVRVPPGWTYEKKDEGLFLRPGDLKESEAYIVIIPPGGRAEGNLAEAFEKSWKRAAGARKIQKKSPAREIKTEGGTEGLMSVGLLESDEGIGLITSVAVFKCADRTEAVLALTAQNDVFQRYSEGLGSLLRGLRFKNTELPSYELLLSMGYTETAGKTTVYVLFKDGTWLSKLPDEGLDDLDGAAAKKRYGDFCGTHETKDREITLRRGAQTEVLKPTIDGTWRSAETGQFLRIPTSTGLRFEGRYVPHGGSGEALAFKADGAVAAGASKAGAYEVLNNSMWFTSADGKNRKVSFALLPKAGEKNPEFILLDGKWLRREP
jgi:hypothetical protein